MAKIIGLKFGGFTPKNSTEKIEGVTVFATEPLRGDNTSGDEAFSFFLSQAKLEAQSFTLAVGQEVELLYNRYGRVYLLRLLSKSDEKDDLLDFGN